MNTHTKKRWAVLLSVLMLFTLFTPIAGVFSLSAAAADVPTQPSDYLLGKYFSNSWAWYDAVSEQNQLDWKAGWPEYSAEKGMMEFQAGNDNTNTYLQIVTPNLFAGVNENTGMTFSYTYSPGLGDWHRHILSLGASEYSGSSNPSNHFYISATNSWLNRDAGNIWTIPVIGYVDGSGTEHIQAMPAAGAPTFEEGRTYNITVTITVNEGVRYNIDGTDYDAIYFNSNLNDQKQYIRAFLNAVAGWQYNYIGCSRWADGNFRGFIKDLCIYGKAYTKAQLDTPVSYSNAFINEAKTCFDVNALALSNFNFNTPVTVIDGNPVAADYYSNVVYSNGMQYYGDGNGYDICGMYYKMVVPETLVTVYDGTHDILVPVETETKVNNNQNNVIHAITYNSDVYSLYQNWIGHMDGTGDNWKTWGSTTQQYPTAQFSYQSDNNVGVDPSECQYLDGGGDYHQNNTGTSRFWWNRLKYTGAGNNTSYYQYDSSLTFNVFASRKPSTGSRIYSGECPITCGVNHYVINYEPVYQLLSYLTSYYNNYVKDKEWMYTEESLDQVMVALYLVQLSNPNNYNFANDTAATVRSCASCIKQAVTECSKMNLVKKTGTVYFKDNEGNVLRTYENVDYGTELDYNTIDTTKTSVSQAYEFTGWNPSTVTVVQDPEKTYTATYNITARQYTITFKNEDGTVMKTENVVYGNYPTPPTLPSKDPDANYHYSAAWDDAITAVEGEKTYTVVFTPAAHTGGAATCLTRAACIECGTAYGELADHNYGELHAAVPPSCTEPGTVAYYRCSVCQNYFDENHTQIDSIVWASGGHTLGTWIPEQPATCTADGVKGHYHCSGCQKDFDADENELTSLVIPAGHTYGEWIPETAATCAAEGEKGHYHCSGCNTDFDAQHNVIDDLVIPKADHSYGAWASNGNGTHTRTCSVCTAEAEGHSQTENCAGGTATCLVKAECTVCHGEYGELAAHSFGEWIPETPATCDGAGEKAHYHCGVCGKDFDASYAEIADLTIPAAHTYGDWIPETPATCAAEGEKGHYQCSTCLKYFDAEYNLIDDLTIPRAAHSYGDWATDENGTHTRTCTVCTAETEGHSQTENCSGGTATCAAKAQCAVCGGEYGELAGHTYGNWINQVNNSCLTDGVKGHYHCSVCGKDFDGEYHVLDTVTIPAVGHHTFGDWIEETPATCTVNGAKAHYHCSVCGKNFNADYEEVTAASLVLAAHHTPVYVEEVPATETQNGTKAHYDCAVCGKHFSDEACTHELSDADLVEPATGDETPQELQPTACPLCGEHHATTMWGRVKNLVHTIVYVILLLFNK